MSVPSLTGMNLLDNADSTTNWSGWGNNTGKWGTSSEFVKEGNASNACQPNNTGDSGWGRDSLTSFDATANKIVIWVYIATTAFVNTMDNKGIYIRICTGASWTNEYLDYYMGGNDVKWCGRGWHLLVLDANRTADASNGSTNKASITQVGVGFNISATASKSDVICIDAMYYGAGVEVTGPSLKDGVNGIDLNDNGVSDDTIVRQDAGSWITDGFEVGDQIKVVDATTAANNGEYEVTNVTASTLTIPTGSLASTENNDITVLVMASVRAEDIYTKDGPTDDTWWGVIDQGPQGAWVVNYPLTIGDVSGSNNIFFLSRGELIIFADQALDTTLEDYLISAEDTGQTHIRFGSSTGTGDNRVGFGGSVVFGEGTDFDYGVGSTSRTVKTPRGIDFDAGITACEMFGCSLIDLDGGAKFYVTGTGHYITNTSFQSCGQIDIGGVESRNLTFTGYSGSDGALLWRNSVTDIKNSYFLANTNSAGNASGIEHTTASTGEGYVGLQFAGNNYDLNFSAATGDLTINASKGLFASNPSTYWNQSTGSVSIVNTVSVTITVQDEAGVKIQNAQVGVYKDSDNSEIMNKDTNVSGVAQVTDFNYTVDTAVNIRVRKGSPGDPVKYLYVYQPALIESEGLSATITLYVDTQNNS